MPNTVLDFQKKLLPFTILLVFVLLLAFVILYFSQMNELQAIMSQPPAAGQLHGASNGSIDQREAFYQLEKYSLDNRYYCARIFIRMRILVISFAFLTGTILCFLGAGFILAKYSEEASQVETTLKGVNLKLISSSPGIVLSVIGVVLICVSVFAKADVEVKDKAVYLPYLVNGEDFDSVSLYHALMSDSTLLRSHPVDIVKKKKIDSMFSKFKFTH